jgi:Methylamine utilisation protein MauE
MPVRITIGGAFLLSGLLKLTSISSFRESLRSYRLFSEEEVSLIAFALPPVEMILGILFAASIRTTVVGLSIVTLLTLFTAVTAVAVAQGQHVDCGCFPIEGRSNAVGPLFFVRNALLVLGVIWATTSSGIHLGERSKAGERTVRTES